MEESWRARLRMRNKQMKNKEDYTKSCKHSLMPEKGKTVKWQSQKEKQVT